ncbi:endothelin-converting enzyme 2-like [Xenia sp. Carnegie-2017]|uniref:endothelin-converting enzyme 2-like n=1 Tax=Xenia sp. Carnegie-2017 TaxID=2897299 RepID=UPI001F03BDB2|nr:endothelin-converting enzyme 2-like [Xenia sp. Carnegie-2017]
MAVGITSLLRTVLFTFCTLQRFSFSLPFGKNYLNKNLDSADGDISLGNSSSRESQNGKVCSDKECVRVAASIKAAINEKMDPCENFYEYACGSWMKSHPIPKDQLQISAFTELRDQNKEMMKNALVEDGDHFNDVVPIRKLRTFFQSCVNIQAIDKLDKKPVLNFINDINSWAVDENSGWASEEWDLFDTLKKIQKEYSSRNLFFSVETIPDPLRNDTDGRNILLIDKAPLDLHPLFFILSPKMIRLLYNYMTNVTELTGVERQIAKSSMKEVLRFEAKLALISFAKRGKLYARLPLRKLAKAIPQFPWLEHLQSLVSPNKLTGDDPVLVLATPYLPTLFKILDKTKKEVLSNFIVWRMIKSYVPMLGNDFRKLYSKLKGDHESRSETCYTYTSKMLSNLLGALFIRKRFSAKVKSDVEEMMNDIIKAFKNNTQIETWLSQKSRHAVEIKLKNVQSKVGYPDYLWNEETLNSRYENLDVEPNKWFQNVVNTQKYLNNIELHHVGEKIDTTHWLAPPQMVNAFYVLTKNEIVIPAGILQEPFFYSGSIPKALSYGAVGHVLGHELTHGFDDSGRTFNKIGKKVSFNETGWSNISDKNFKNASKCLVKQFSEFEVLGKHNVDGKMTLGENIADAGGLKLAFNAYKRWIIDHGEQEILPNLDKSNDELFFIGFAQKSCTNTSHLGQFIAVNDDDHAPSKFRVNGALSNMPEFSETFHCPVDSKMNRKKKCDVW